MSLRTDVERVIGEAVKGTEVGLLALTEGPVHLDPEGGAVMAEVMRLQVEILERCDELQVQLQRLG